LANELLVRKLKETLKEPIPLLQEVQKESLENQVHTLDKNLMALRNGKGYYKEIKEKIK